MQMNPGLERRARPWLLAGGLAALAAGAVLGRPSPQRIVAARAAALPPGLTRAVDELGRIGRARDARALTRWVAPDVRVDAGPTSELWPRLARALELGGAYRTGRGDEYVIPWIAARWPSEVSPEGRVAIVVPRAALRAAPSDAARVRAVLGHEIVRLAGAHEPAEPGWLKVRTPGGVYGFVRAAQVWAPGELRVVLAADPGGGWRIVALSTVPAVRATAAPFTIPR